MNSKNTAYQAHQNHTAGQMPLKDMAIASCIGIGFGLAVFVLVIVIKSIVKILKNVINGKK